MLQHCYCSIPTDLSEVARRSPHLRQRHSSGIFYYENNLVLLAAVESYLHADSRYMHVYISRHSDVRYMYINFMFLLNENMCTCSIRTLIPLCKF